MATVGASSTALGVAAGGGSRRVSITNSISSSSSSASSAAGTGGCWGTKKFIMRYSEMPRDLSCDSLTALRINEVRLFLFLYY